MKPIQSFVSLVGMLSVPLPSQALNVPVATKVIAFVRPPYLGTVLAAIVFEPGNPASEAEADAIEEGIGAGGHNPSAFRLKRVPSNAVIGLAGAKVAFVTGGIRYPQALAEAAQRYAVLTITSDLACVKANFCVLGVSSAPRAEIFVSRAAAGASRIRFGSAFLMLIREN